MSKPKRTAPARCWRGFVCAACACRYKCLIRPAAPAPGDEEPAPGDPTNPMTDVAARALPCPNCAAVPGSRAAPAARHKRLALLVAIGMVGAGLGFNGNGHFSSALAFAAIALLSALGHLFISAVSRRRMRAAPAKPPAADARVRIVGGPQLGRRGRIGPWFCRAAAVAVVPVCLLPVLLVEALGWPRLKSADQEIVSPGDTLHLTLSGPSIRFSAYRVVRMETLVANADELGGPRALRIESPAATGILTAHKNGEYQLRHPVQIEVPNAPGWVGHTARVSVHLVLENTNADKQAPIPQNSSWTTVEIPVAPEGAGAQYQTAWWVALFGGALPAILLGFVWAKWGESPGPTPPSPTAPA